MELSGFQLPALEPYIARYTGVTLLSGRLGAKADLERDAKGRLTVAADTDVASFRTVDDELRMDFIKWIGSLCPASNIKATRRASASAAFARRHPMRASSSIRIAI